MKQCEFLQMESVDSRTERYHLGPRVLPGHVRVQQRVPGETTESEISGRVLPPERVSERNRVFVHLERRRELVALYYGETNTFRRSGFIENAKPFVTGTVAGVRDVHARSDGV